VEVLASIGAPAAIPAIRRAVERELDGRIKRRGREVIRDLAEGRGASEAVRELHDDVDRLRLDLNALRERLAKLEGGRGGKPKGDKPTKKPARKRK